MSFARVLCILVAAWCAARSWAQTAPSAEAARVSSPAHAHGWLTLDARTRGVLLGHLPPRRAGGYPDGVAHGFADGTLRPAMPLAAHPVALTSSGPRVYLVYDPPPESKAPSSRAVLTLRAEASGAGDFWRFQPEDRPDVVASLPGDGRLLGFSASRAGLFALLSAAPGSPPRLLRLVDGAWRSLSVPPEFAALSEAMRRVPMPASGPSPREPEHQQPDGPVSDSEPAHLVATERGVALAVRTPEGGVVWETTLDKSFQSPQAEQVWTMRGLAIPSSHLREGGPWDILELGGALVGVTRTGAGEVLVSALGPSEGYELARIPAVPARFALATIDAPLARLVLVWQTGGTNPGPGAGLVADAAAGLRNMIVEISARTGRVLYSGVAQAGGLITAGEFRFLVFVLLAIMTMTLLFVLRPTAPGAAFQLADGFALAPAGRRLVASVIDLVVAGLVSARIWSIPAIELLYPTTLFSDQGLPALLTALGVGLFVGTLSETAWGRTLGKGLMGCRVCRVSANPDGTDGPTLVRPAIWQALGRNAVKWALPPVALLALVDPEGRHRGEVATRTAVVVRLENDTADDVGPDA